MKKHHAKVSRGGTRILRKDVLDTHDFIIFSCINIPFLHSAIYVIKSTDIYTVMSNVAEDGVGLSRRTR